MQRETTSYCGNGCGNRAVSGGFECGRISDDKVCGALVVRGGSEVNIASVLSKRVALSGFLRASFNIDASSIITAESVNVAVRQRICMYIISYRVANWGRMY